MPTVSCILAVYNARRYVREAAESILQQTYRDFELILLDDGSTDGSAEILDELAARDPRVRLVRRPNKGLTPTLNEGLALAGGPFVARMDADDVSLPERFEKQVAFLESRPDVVCVGSQIETMDPYGSRLDRPLHPLTHGQIDADLLKGIGWSIVHPAAMMRTLAVRRVGGYREQFSTSQDLDLWLRLAEVGQLANLPDVLLRYRQHFESVASTKAQTQWRLKTTIVSDAYERRGLPRPTAWPFRKREPIPRSKQLELWTWAALRAGNGDVARRHAWAHWKLRPLTPRSWKLLACAIRGR
jgi:glycosyltransferase involved in cell wall biosynthesis